jgi:hypothetical protein
MNRLLAWCVVIPTAMKVNAREPEPRSILCEGTAVSPVSYPDNAKVSLSATINFDRDKIELLLVDHKSGKVEFPGEQETGDGARLLDVFVLTGSLTVQRARQKVLLKMLWQKAGMSQDFIGLPITKVHVCLAGRLVGLWQGTEGHADAVRLL